MLFCVSEQGFLILLWLYTNTRVQSSIITDLELISASMMQYMLLLWAIAHHT